jgi:hypothetical protein
MAAHHRYYQQNQVFVPQESPAGRRDVMRVHGVYRASTVVLDFNARGT